LTALQDCQVPLAPIIGLHPMTGPFGLPVYRESPTVVGETFRPEGLRSLGSYVRRSTGLCVFTVFPTFGRHELTPTFQSSNGCWTCDPPNPHAGLLPLAGVLSFRSSSRSTLTSHSSQKRLLSMNAVTLRLAVRTWLPCLVLPPCHSPDSISGFYTAKRRCV